MFEKNKHFEIEITDLGSNGEGIGKIEGFAFFIEGALPGDLIEMRIVKLKKNYGYGKLIRIIIKSPDRVEPECPVFSKCGGCTLSHMSYEAQLRFKTKKVGESLKRIGKVNAEIAPIIGMSNPYSYRNKAQFPVREENGKTVVGFFAQRSHNIIPIESCCIQHPVNKDIIKTVLDFMIRRKIKAYNEQTHSGLVRHIVTRVGFKSGQIMVCLVLNGTSLPYSEELTDELKKIDGMTSIVLNINTEKTNVILGKEIKTIWGSTSIVDYISGIKFEISPLSFYQVNQAQAEILYDKACEFAELNKASAVIDAYCGIGTISLVFAKTSKSVTGIEIVPEAIQDAKRNAALNDITNAEFITGEAQIVIPKLLGKTAKNRGETKTLPQIVVVDPPRKGCDVELINALNSAPLERIVYISCDPSTLARDVALLTEGGYEVLRVQPVDMFPQTSHVETVVLLSKLKSTEFIEVKIDLDEMDLTTAESKATYDEIKQYVFDNAGLKVSQLYIAQVKKKCGIIERINYNIGEGKTKTPQVPSEKEKAIVDALKHFQMI